MDLHNKTAVITGAAGGVGSSTARRFAESGAKTMLIDMDQAALQSLAAALPAGDAHHVEADVTSDTQLAAAARQTAEKLGKIDILFVNAGIEQPMIPLAALPETVFDRIVNVNLKGSFLTVKNFLPVLNDGASIIITSSIAALVGIHNNAAYSATKAGVVGMMRSIVLEVSPRGIRCNTVHPGLVNTKMLARAAQEGAGDLSLEEWYKMAAKIAKLNRLVEPEDVADLVVFLASDRSRMITGQTISVDGGAILGPF